MNALRTVLWEHKFEAELRKIEPDAKRGDALVSGAEWVLAKAPTKGTHMPRTHVWTFFLRDIPKGRSLTIYYTFDADQVYFMSVTTDTFPMPSE
jgi:hypothetical protein